MNSTLVFVLNGLCVVVWIAILVLLNRTASRNNTTLKLMQKENELYVNQINRHCTILKEFREEMKNAKNNLTSRSD